MKIIIEGQEISYLESGSGKPLVALHGWGCNKEIFDILHQHYANSFRVITVDLPGFGESDEPKSVWGSADYSHCILQLFKELSIESPIVIGHSFGGRVLLAAGEKNNYFKMILTGSAGLVPKRPFSYYWKIYRYKLLKWLYFHTPAQKAFPNMLEHWRNKSSSEDYRNATERMKAILVKVVNEDLSKQISQISVPTILLWGTEDTATPILDGKRMAFLMKDAALIPLEGGSHYAFFEQMQKSLRIMDSFLGGN